MRRLGYLFAAAYVATVFLANFTLQRFGFIHVWPGVLAPAGVLWAGVALTLRDIVQDTLGRRAVVLAILAGAALSYFVSPTFATASAIAFLVSETLDSCVYTPLHHRHWLAAVALSNTVGLVADSCLFLWLAFGSLAYLEGQIIGKVEVTVAAVAVLWSIRRWEPTWKRAL